MKRWLSICRTIALAIILVVATLGLYISYLWYQSEDYRVGGVPVLNYHQVNDSKEGALTVSTEEFERQMAYLKDHHYNTIDCDQLYYYLVEGRELPEKPVLITFDDGYRDNYEKAFPILEKYEMKATLFMIGDSVGAERFVTREELQEMEAKGFSIESHTYTHHWLVDESREEVADEIRKTSAVLSSIVDRPIYYLAYPGGFKNELVEKTVAEEGIRMAFTVYPNTVHRGDNLMALPRLPIFAGEASHTLFIARLHLGPLAYQLAQLRDYAIAHDLDWLLPFIPFL